MMRIEAVTDADDGKSRVRHDRDNFSEFDFSIGTGEKRFSQ
jgi:hypothetical protein